MGAREPADSKIENRENQKCRCKGNQVSQKMSAHHPDRQRADADGDQNRHNKGNQNGNPEREGAFQRRMQVDGSVGHPRKWNDPVVERCKPGKKQVDRDRQIRGEPFRLQNAQSCDDQHDERHQIQQYRADSVESGQRKVAKTRLRAVIQPALLADRGHSWKHIAE